MDSTVSRDSDALSGVPIVRATGSLVAATDADTARVLATPLATLIDSLSDIVLLYDPHGRLVRMNTTTRRLLALDAVPGFDALPYVERVRLLSPRAIDGSPLPEGEWPVVRVLRGEVVTEAEPALARITGLDGREHILSYTGTPIRDERDGTVIGGITIARDVTEPYLRSAEREALGMEYRTLVEQAADGILVAGPDGKHIAVNARACALLGYSQDELLSMRMDEIVFPEDMARLAETEAKLRTGVALVAEWELRRKDGSRAPVEINSRLLADGRCQAILRDISERKRLEREVAVHAGQLSATFDALSDGLIVFDAAGRLVRMNTAAQSLLSLAAPLGNYVLPAEGASRFEVRDERGGTLTSEQWPISRILRGESMAGASAMDVIIRSLDGTGRRLSVSGAPVRDERGVITGAVCIMHDVTERRRLEDERVRMLEIVAHELKTPVAAVSLQAQMLRRRVDAGRSVEAAQFEPLERGAKRMARLVEDLLDATRMERGTAELARERVDLAELCAQAAQEQMAASSRRVQVRLPRGRLEVEADPARMTQVLVNLLANALRYSPPETEVRLVLRAESMPGHPRGSRPARQPARQPERTEYVARMARVEVRDSGPGIPPDALKSLFERFYQVPGTVPQFGSGAGLGLGLYVCRQLVEAHGGQIGVESRTGEGATFWFTLPLAPASES